MKISKKISRIFWVTICISVLGFLQSCPGGSNSVGSGLANLSLSSGICGNGVCQAGLGEGIASCPDDCFECMGTLVPGCCEDYWCYDLYGENCTDDNCCDSLNEDIDCDDCLSTNLMEGCTGTVNIVADGGQVYAQNNKMVAYGYVLNGSEFYVIEPKGFILAPTKQEVLLGDDNQHDLEVVPFNGFDMARWGTDDEQPEDKVAIANIGVVVSVIVDFVGVLPVDISGTSVGFCMNITDLKTVGEILYGGYEQDWVDVIAGITEFIAENVDNLAICLWQSTVSTAQKEALISGLKGLGKVAGEITRIYDVYVVLGKIAPTLLDLYDAGQEDSSFYCVSRYNVDSGECPDSSGLDFCMGNNYESGNYCDGDDWVSCALYIEFERETCPNGCQSGVGCISGTNYICGPDSKVSFGDGSTSVSDRCACSGSNLCSWSECDAGMELPVPLIQFAKVVDSDANHVFVLGGSTSTSTTSSAVYLTDLGASPPVTSNVGSMVKGASGYNVGDVTGVLYKQGGGNYAVLVGGITGGPGSQINGDNVVTIELTGADGNDSTHEYTVTPIANLAPFIKPSEAPSVSMVDWSRISGSCAALHGSDMIMVGGYSETRADYYSNYDEGYLDIIAVAHLSAFSSPDIELIGRLPHAVADAACAVVGDSLYVAGGANYDLPLMVYNLTGGTRCDVDAASTCGFGTYVGGSWDAMAGGDTLVITRGASVLDGNDLAAGFNLSTATQTNCTDSCAIGGDFCQANGYTSGSYCDGNDRVVCGQSGSCALELERETCADGCSGGQCSGGCTPGPCCDGNGDYRPSTYVCDTETEYGCPWGTACGNNVGRRTRDRYCSGSSSTCNGSYGSWSVWDEHDNCSLQEVCDWGDSTCDSSSLCCDCTTGDCCDGCDYWPSSHVCDIEIEYGCPWGTACEMDVGKRTRNRYCSGSSASCSGSYGSWSSWSVYDNCSSSEVCAVGDPSCNFSASCQCTIGGWSASLNATGVFGGVQLSWNSHPNADYYIITRADGAIPVTCPPTPANDLPGATPTGTSYFDGSAQSGETYLYGIYAVKDCGSDEAVSGCGGIDTGGW